MRNEEKKSLLVLFELTSDIYFHSIDLIMTLVILDDDTLQFPRIICGAVIIALIITEPVNNPCFKQVFQWIIPALVFERLLIFVEILVNYWDMSSDYQLIIWKFSQIIRIVISLSLCYPLSLCIRDNQQKFRSVSIYICCLMIIGTMFDLFQVNDGRSGVNYIAPLMISVFTLYQYQQLRRRPNEQSPSQLNNLIFLELIMMIFYISSMILLFLTGYQMEFFRIIQITVELFQLQKFYAMIMMIIQLNPTNHSHGV